MNTVLQLNEFFVEGKNPNKSHVLLNITEPSTIEERQKGYFFAVCEINGADSKYIMKVQNIIDELENQYYDNNNPNNSNNLEDVLNQINKKTPSLINDNINLEIALGAVIDNQIIFSFLGSPQIVLFYQTKQGSYKKMDLVEQEGQSDEEEKPMAFSQIVEGKISERDYLFVGNNRIKDYFTHDRIQKIICSRSPKQSVQHLQRVLSELKNGLSFGGMIMHLQNKEDKLTTQPIKKPNKGSSAKSLRGLFTTHANTANILSPSILPRLKNTSHEENNLDEKDADQTDDEVTDNQAQINSTHLKTRPTEMPSIRERYNKKGVDWRAVISVILGYSWIIIKILGRFLLWLLIALASVLKKIGISFFELFLVATNIRKQRTIIISNWKKQINDFRINIKRMSMITKILILLGIVLGIIFISVTYYLRSQQNKQMALDNFNQAVQQIKNKKDTAESYLIFDEDTKAYNELLSANQQLAGLKCVELQQTDTCNKLKSDLNILMNKVRKLYTTTPTLLTTWNGTEDYKLFLTNKKIFAYNSKSGQLNSYSLLTKESGFKTPSASVNGFKAASTPEEDDYSILIDNSNNVLTYNPKADSYEQSEMSYPNSNNDVASTFIYSRRLYIVDATNNQIYRHDPTNNGFGKGASWINNNSGIDLKNNIALAIDGDVYTMNSDGKLYKFAAGKLQDYSLPNIDPKLDSVNDMWTYYKMTYLYILDGKNKRLIIIDKDTGKLKKQLTATSFNNPTGMIIDETSGVAYIYDSGKLYEVDMEL